MAQQTAVEWFAESLILNGLADYLTEEDYSLYKELKQQAKEMEKQEKAKCWIASAKYGLKILNTGEEANFKAAFEQYYTETYGK
jgi:hypothetical protein